MFCIAIDKQNNVGGCLTVCKQYFEEKLFAYANIIIQFI